MVLYDDLIKKLGFKVYYKFVVDWVNVFWSIKMGVMV
jgi:hypothetical protein